MRRALPIAVAVVLVNDLALAALLAPRLRVPALVGLGALLVAGAVWVPVATRTKRARAPPRHELAAEVDALRGRVETLEAATSADDAAGGCESADAGDPDGQ